MNHFRLLFAACMITIFLPAGKTPPKPNILFRFHVEFFDGPLTVNKDYVNDFNDTFRISRLRFYVGKIGLQLSDTSQPVQTDPLTAKYFLFDTQHAAALEIRMHLPPGDYQRMHYQLGIDSTDQVSGARSGALDPINGMYWTWNSGYTMCKIDGSSPRSNQPFHAISYHLGGYRAPFATMQKIVADPGPDWPLTIREDSLTYVDIVLELNHFFYAGKSFRIGETPTCTAPGQLARDLSINFARSFSFPDPNSYLR